MTNDDPISDTLKRVRTLVELHNMFTPAPDRADGLLIGQNGWEGWSLETRFIHGEGTIDLMQGRTRGEREVGWRKTWKIHGPRNSHEIMMWFENALYEATGV